MIPAVMKKGFSLSEVMVAVLVLGVVITPLFFLFSHGTAGALQTRDEILAYNYACGLLDFALAQPFDAPLLKEPGGAVDPDLLDLVSTSGPTTTMCADKRFQQFLRISIPPVPSGWPIGYKILVSEVQWVSAGITRKIQISGLKCRSNS